MGSNQLKNHHLFWRAGFGPKAEELQWLAEKSPKEVYKTLVKRSQKSPEYISVATNWAAGYVGGIKELIKNETVTMNINGQQVEMSKQEIRKKQREEEKNINLRWLDQLVNSDGQLREKMAFFWHGHFACRNLNAYYQQILLNIIRKNALGKFSDLLSEVSKSASMLQFLNNQQNRKQHPNENFAREVMELFTLGRGNYTENDVKEAARAFTGWSFTPNGEFQFRENAHDTGSKTLLGYTGNFNGDDVLEILLEQKQTAKYITRKIYKFFVNEIQIDEEKVNWLADRFYKNDYDIQKLMDDIFLSDWFYDQHNIAAKIKSPVELIAGIRRMLPLDLETEEVQLLFQKLLGQILLYPPNVAGWPGGKWWIDSTTLFYRMRLPQVINAADELNVSAKNDDDVNMGRMNDEMLARQKVKGLGRLGGMMKGKIQWEVYLQNFSNTNREQLIDVLSKTLLQQQGVSKELLDKYADKDTKEDFIKSVTIHLMSTPEYQMC
jgi:uncharacterized protein (DUF1800 family)